MPEPLSKVRAVKQIQLLRNKLYVYLEFIFDGGCALIFKNYDGRTLTGENEIYQVNNVNSATGYFIYGIVQFLHHKVQVK